MKKLEIAYFGSPDFAASFLEKTVTDIDLKKYLNIRFVVTQPDQKAGRERIITPTPVKLTGRKYGIPVYDYQPAPRTSKSGIKYGVLTGTQIAPETLTGLDFVLTYAYGAIISSGLINLPRLGFWNIHPSLLPRYRGTSPIAAPLVNGDRETGVTIIKMDNLMDHGPIIAQLSYTVKNTDYRPNLETKLTELGFELFKKTVIKLAGSGEKLETHEQTGTATYTNKLKKNDGFIEFKNLKFQISNSPEKLYNLFRGLYPWPGIWTNVNIKGSEKRLKITGMSVKKNGDSSINLHLERVQLEGKKEVDYKTFSKAYGIII